MTSLQAASFTGFDQQDFDVFQKEGLEERMAGIQSLIQPKFRAIGERLCVDAALFSGNEMFLHIAKHARRKVNPPKDTWLAICGNKRGYKAHPHYQLGLFDDHLFLWLALIYEIPNKKAIASAFLDQIDEVIDLVPSDFVLSQDHMKKEAQSVASMSKDAWAAALTRFRDVQKVELLIGRQVMADDPILQDGNALHKLASTTFEQLAPLYRLSFV